MESRKRKFYKEKIVPTLKEKLGFENDLQVPKLQKIVITRGINSEEAKTASIIEDLANDLAVIAGQKPVICKAKKSIATFKLREGMPNGIMVTLRANLMYAFLDRFISLACPRIRDFQGFKIKSDGRGNYTVGIKDQRIFMETENRSQKGLQIVFVTSAIDDQTGRALLEEFGFPFSKN
jgi:large subunit ribosomal protein L5